MAFDNIAPINEVQLSDLTSTTDALPETFVTPPSAGNPNGPEAVIGADPGAVNDTPEQVQAALDALLNANTQIATTEDNITKVADLKDVVSTVMAQESISQSDVEEIDRKVGGYLGDEVSIKEFTEAPSRIGLEQTRQFAQRRLEDQVASTKQQFEAFVAATKDHAVTLLTSLQKSVPVTIEMLESAEYVAARDLPRHAKCNRFWAFHTNKEGQPDGDAFDLRYGYIRSGYDEGLIGVPEEIQQVHAMVFRAFNQAADFKPLRELLMAQSLNAANEPFRQVLNKVKHGTGSEEERVRASSFINALQVLASGGLSRFLSLVLSRAAEAAGEVERMLQVANAPGAVLKEERDDYGAYEGALANACREMSEYYLVLTKLAQYEQAARLFVNATVPLIDAFGRVLDREEAKA